jgi:hypothetical protein
MATTKRTKRTPKVIAASSAYIDPINCNSTVSYKVIHGSRRIWADVQLADCNHKIEWYFGSSSKESLAKVNKAIEILEEFRDALTAAYAAQPKPVRRKRTAVK